MKKHFLEGAAVNNRWRPNATVAAVIPRGDQFLMVEEIDRDTGARVFNQPAGHLDPQESLIAAVEREALEETRWEVRATGYLGVARLEAPNGITYLRHSFVCEPLREIGRLRLDDGIIAAHWMSLEDLEGEQDRLRSPLVLAVIRHFLAGMTAPLALVVDSPHL